MKVRKFKIRIRPPGEPLGADFIRTFKLAEKGIFETEYDLASLFRISRNWQNS